MTESIQAVMRVASDGRVVALGSAAVGFLGGAGAREGRDTAALSAGAACAALVRATDPHGRPICRAECAQALATSEPPRRDVQAALVRGKLARLQCERVGDEVVVVLTTTAEAAACSETLTARERVVLAWVARGLTDREVAAQLGIRASTVRTHVEHARDKLGVRTRAHAAMRARALGQID